LFIARALRFSPEIEGELLVVIALSAARCHVTPPARRRSLAGAELVQYGRLVRIASLARADHQVVLSRAIGR
jgi:hypothetical protein